MGDKRITISFGGIPLLTTFVLLVLKLLGIGTFGWFWVFFPLIFAVGLVIGLIVLWVLILLIGFLLKR